MCGRKRVVGLGLLLAVCGALGAVSSRSPVLPAPRFGTTASSQPSRLSRTGPSTDLNKERRRKPRLGKRSKLPYPSRRCAALIDVRTQCPGNAVEPSDYCAQHQKLASRVDPRR
jgi:hypothetical protein